MRPEDFIAHLPMPALVVGPDRQIAGANTAFRARFGDFPPGRHYMNVLRQPALVEAIEAALDAGRPATRLRLSLHDRPREEVYRASVSPLGAEAGPGQGGGVLVVLEDITPFEEARRARRDFVANVSHELRTPLTALTGFIEALRGPARDDPEARARFLDTMEREAGRMSRLISDLLSLARVEQDERRRPDTPLAIAPLLDEVAATLAPQARAGGVELVVLTPPRPLPQVPGDADQLRQVFLNLVENAIKYGGAGEGENAGQVTIEAGTDLTGVPEGFVGIAVSDQGPGIAAHHLGRLTERFYRVDDHRSRNMGGTGLGLAIVKHILNRHRGRLRITSQPGRGSRFLVLLPRA